MFLVMLLTGIAMAASLPLPLGTSLWSHNAGIVVALAAAAAAMPAWARRRHATMTLAFTGILATATGAMMLYTKGFPYKDWLTWWHVFVSVVFTLAFLLHWFRNHVRLVGFTRSLLTRDSRVGAPQVLMLSAVAAGFVWTGLPAGRVHFTPENYLYLSSWTVLVGVVFTYGIWLAYRTRGLRARLARTPHRNAARALVDTGLWLFNAGALLTGFALLYLSEFLRGGDLKYASKWWHTATSVGLLALLALHIGFNAGLLAAHKRRFDRPTG